MTYIDGYIYTHTNVEAEENSLATNYCYEQWIAQKQQNPAAHISKLFYFYLFFSKGSPLQYNLL